MSNPNGDKGAATERMVAAYLREQGFWMADRRLREGRVDDQGDIDGVPYTTIQVKYVESNRYAAWVVDTLKQRDTAGTPLCMLVRRVPRKPVAQWEASMPYHQVWPGEPYRQLSLGRPDPEQEAWTWVRMDLRLAVAHLHMKVGRESLSDQFLSTTSTVPIWKGEGEVLRSAPSTGSAEPA